MMNSRVNQLATVEKFFAGGGTWVHKCPVAIGGSNYWLYVDKTSWVLNTIDVLDSDNYELNMVIDNGDLTAETIHEYESAKANSLSKLIATIWKKIK